MKLTPAHYDYIKNTIAALNIRAEHIAEHRETIVKAGKAKNIDKCLRWNLLYFAGLSGWIFNNVYPYANDDHIDTALQSIMRELYS